MSTKPAVSDELIAYLARGVTDIRERVVEEPWFGEALQEQSKSSPEREVEQEQDRVADLEQNGVEQEGVDDHSLEAQEPELER